jgi:hypothetical protein
MILALPAVETTTTPPDPDQLADPVLLDHIDQYRPVSGAESEHGAPR